jgi:hypothetical protein
MTAEEIRKLRDESIRAYKIDGSVDERNQLMFFLAEIAAQLAEMNESSLAARRLAYRKGLADGISACLTPRIDPHWPEDCIEAIDWWGRFLASRLEDLS